MKTAQKSKTSGSDMEEAGDADWADLPYDEFLTLITPRENQPMTAGTRPKAKDTPGQKLV